MLDFNVSMYRNRVNQGVRGFPTYRIGVTYCIG
jgi:hypothetical protein